MYQWGKSFPWYISVIVHRKKRKTISTSRWLLNWFFTISFTRKKQVVIEIFIHVHFKLVENHQPFFTFIQFHIRRTQQISHWTIKTALPRINHIRRYEKNITHDDDQLSTETTRDHEDDGIVETEEDCEEEESLFEDIVCYVLYLIVSVI